MKLRPSPSWKRCWRGCKLAIFAMPSPLGKGDREAVDEVPEFPKILTLTKYLRIISSSREIRRFGKFYRVFPLPPLRGTFPRGEGARSASSTDLPFISKSLTNHSTTGTGFRISMVLSVTRQSMARISTPPAAASRSAWAKAGSVASLGGRYRTFSIWITNST